MILLTFFLVMKNLSDVQSSVFQMFFGDSKVNLHIIW